jgi:hypothetical protein
MGAFAMLDALGFKALSLKHPAELREKMHGLVQGMNWLNTEAAEKVSEKGGPTASVPRVTFLSDTVVVGIPIISDPEYPSNADAAAHDDCHTLALAAACAGEIVLRAGQGPHPMAYRGCISFGEYEMDPPFILGPAVNDAAEHYEVAECAAVWLTPTALEVWDKGAGTLPRVHASDPTRPTALDQLYACSVPLKSGGAFETRVASPFSGSSTTRRERIDWRNAVLGSFQGPISVLVKQQNTRRLFRELEDAAGHRLGQLPGRPRRLAAPTPVASSAGADGKDGS